MGMNAILTLFIHRMDFLGPDEKRLIADTFDDPVRLRGLGLADLGAVIGRSLRTVRWQPEELWRQANRDADWLASGLGRLLAPGKPDWPADLDHIPDPPFVLFCRGCPPPEDRELLAVVGTRRPSEAARLAAWELGRDCAALGIGLVSGLAHGIDGAAHAAAVRCRGYTVAVLAGGIDEVHPRMHREPDIQWLVPCDGGGRGAGTLRCADHRPIWTGSRKGRVCTRRGLPKQPGNRYQKSRRSRCPDHPIPGGPGRSWPAD